MTWGKKQLYIKKKHHGFSNIIVFEHIIYTGKLTHSLNIVVVYEYIHGLIYA